VSAHGGEDAPQQTAKTTSPPRDLTWLGRAAIGLALLWVAVRVVAPVDTAITTSFAGYWGVGRAILEGHAVVDLYDDATLLAVMQAAGVPLQEHLLGPPTVGLTLLPLAGLAYGTARQIWLWGVCLPALALGAWLGAAPAGRWRPLLATAIVLSPGAALGLEVGQVYPLYLLLHLLALRATPGSAAAGLAPMLITRGWLGLPLLGVFALRRRTRTVAAVVGATVLLGLLSLPIVGLDAWLHFFTVQLRTPVDPAVAGVTAYQGLPSLAAHLTTAHELWGPDPPIDAPGLRIPLLIAGLGLTAALWWPLRRHLPTALAGAVCIELLWSPFTQDYQLVLAVIPAALALRGRAWPLAVAGVALIVAPYDFTWAGLSGGWRSLLAYPRLAGTLLLLVALAADTMLGGEKSEARR
jgi:hypothetical protein